MGAFYNSICVPGDHRERVRQVLVRWLSGKGFALRQAPVLFDLDGDAERCAFVVSNDRWTVLFYSHYDEERRLIRELRAELAPLVYVWVYDSDVWGYDLFDERGFAGSFGSDPRTHQSFAGEALGTLRRPRCDAERLCRLLALPGKVEKLRRIERRRAPFAEDVCRELCRELEVEVAASSYDDLESGVAEELEGWHSEQLLFARHDLDRGAQNADLHRYDLNRRWPEMGFTATETIALPPEIRAELKRMRRRVRFTHRLLRPLSWLAGALRRRRLGEAQRGGERQPPAPHPAALRDPFHVESAVLVNDRHRCRITLAEGVRPVVVSKRPASVFAFEAGEVTVTCTARRRSKIAEVLRRPRRSEVLQDEKYRVAGLPARHLVFKLPAGFVAGSTEPSLLALIVIQSPEALYVFLYRCSQLLDADVRQAIRSTVDSFRLAQGV